MGNVFKIISRSKGRIREEFVDVKKNTLFKGVRRWGGFDKKDIASAYESFWNMDEYEPKVTVLKVIPANIKSKGESWGVKFITKKKLKEVL